MKKSKPVSHLRDLKLDPKNARKHNERNKKMIRASLEEVGGFRSIAVDGNDIVRAGNGVYEQAQALGLKVRVVDAKPDELIAVRRKDLKGKKAERAALYDNRASETSEWDADVIADIAKSEKDLLAGMFEEKELREIVKMADAGDGEQDAEPQIDRAAELNKKWKVKRGDLWKIGEHRLLCGDSTVREDVERVMGGEKAQMIFTDPPYALMGNSTGVNGITDDKMTAPFFREVFKRAKEFTVNFSHIYVCCDWHSAFALRQSGIDVGLTEKNLIVWDKGDGGVGAMYQQCYELIWFFANTPRSNLLTATAVGERTVNGIPNIWRVGRMSSEREHGAQKPLDLVEIPIKHGCDEFDIVLDLFSGSGTTLVACENLKRKCRAMEIAPDYCAVILERMATAFPNLKIERIEEQKVNGKAKRQKAR